MNTTVTSKPLGDTTSNFAEGAADSAHNALRSTQNVANAAFDRLNDKVDSARDQAVPLINRLSSQAEAAARRGADAVKETSAQLREKALHAQDTTVGYIKDEPIKAMLIAAATGAALMALVRLASRSSRH
ncbi:MAG: hypothetical protein H7Y61_10740 [Rhizobiales bacterium]|nr:hypothetical protein [Rhizobacter sp.]